LDDFNDLLDIMLFAEVNEQPVHFGHLLNKKKTNFASKKDEETYNVKEANGAISYDIFRSKVFSEDRNGSEVDFWTWNQSINFKVWHDEFFNYGDTWDYIAPKLRYFIQGLPQGKHTVRLSLKYRLRSLKYDAVTPISHPLASGEFIIDTTQEIPRSMIIFPERKTKLSHAEVQELEDAAREYFKLAFPEAAIMHVSLDGEWGTSLREEITEYRPNHFEKKIHEEHFIKFCCVVYVFNSMGEMSWQHGDYISMRRGYLFTQNTPPNGKHALPFVNSGMEDYREFPASYLPREIPIPKRSDTNSAMQKYA
jgi:hypothetical protein